MGRSKHSGGLDKHLGGLSGKAAKSLRTRKSRLDAALEEATGTKKKKNKKY